jgi:hypothetical protein
VNFVLTKLWIQSRKGKIPKCELPSDNKSIIRGNKTSELGNRGTQDDHDESRNDVGQSWIVESQGDATENQNRAGIAESVDDFPSECHGSALSNG